MSFTCDPMADPQQLALLKQGVEKWNAWRQTNRNIEIHLSDADLRGATFRDTYLIGADLRGADLRGAGFWVTHFQGADLRGADLRGIGLVGTFFGKADLRGALQGPLPPHHTSSQIKQKQPPSIDW